MLYRRNRVLKNQEVLFKKSYMWIITITVNSLNFLITYDLGQAHWGYVYYYLLDILTTYIVLEFYAFGIRILNKKLPLNGDFTKRLLYQLTLHTLSVMIFNILLNEFFDYIFFDSERLSLSLSFYTGDTALALVFLLLLHAIYFTLFLVYNQKNKSLLLTGQKIKVIDGMNFKFLVASDIVAIYILHGNTYVIDTSFKKYISNQPLREFEEKFNDDYFRINRKFILSKQIIDSYKSIENGKIEVSLKNKKIDDLMGSIIVSRDRASSFRSWIK